MELLFLGTAAAEGAPALFCTCEHCAYARRVKGKEIRTRAGSLVDGVLKIDFGPDSYKQMLDNDIDYTHMTSVIVTHSHDDHLAASEFQFRRQGFAQLPKDEPVLTVYGNDAVVSKVTPYLSDMVKAQAVHSFVPFEAEGYTITPLEALHCVSDSATGYPVYFKGKKYFRTEETNGYLIEKDGRSLYYAHDTGGITDANLEFLKGRKLDLISLDCDDCSWDTQWIGHMGITRDLEAREQLLSVGAADSHTVFVANHFSHNGLIPYEKIQERMPGFLVSYDGMKVRV